MATGKRVDPYGSFNFAVEIDGINRAYFQECSGFDSSIEVIEHREGGDAASRKLPGPVKYENITLKWGLTDDAELYDWHKQWVDGDSSAKRVNGSIVLLDRQGNEKVRWNFYNAWPAKYDGPDFNAEGTDMAIETLELAHERVERVSS